MENVYACYLNPGTYYCRGSRWNGAGTLSFKTYLGFAADENIKCRRSGDQQQSSCDGTEKRKVIKTNEEERKDRDLQICRFLSCNFSRKYYT